MIGMDTAADLAVSSSTIVKHSMLPHKVSSGQASRRHDSAPLIDSIALQHGQAPGAAGCQRVATTQAERNAHCAAGSIGAVKQEEALDISLDTADAHGHAAPKTLHAPRCTCTSWLKVQLCVEEHRVAVSMHAQPTAAHEDQGVQSRPQLAADAAPSQGNPPTLQDGPHSGCQTLSPKAAINAVQPPIVRSACNALGTSTACAPAPTWNKKPSRLDDLLAEAPEHLTTMDAGMEASAEEWTKRGVPSGVEAAAQSQTKHGASVPLSPGARPNPHAGSQRSHSSAHRSEQLDPSSFKHASPAADIDAAVCPTKFLASSTDPISTPQALTSRVPLSAGGLAAGALILSAGQAAPAPMQTKPSAATMPCSQMQTPVPHDSMDDIELDGSPFASAIDSGRNAAPPKVAPALELPAWPPSAGANAQHAAGMFALPSSNAPLYSGRAESLLAASGGTAAKPSTPHLAAEAHTVGCNTRIGTATASPAFTPILSFKRRRCDLLHITCADHIEVATAAPVCTSAVAGDMSLARKVQYQGCSCRLHNPGNVRRVWNPKSLRYDGEIATLTPKLVGPAVQDTSDVKGSAAVPAQVR